MAARFHRKRDPAHERTALSNSCAARSGVGGVVAVVETGRGDQQHPTAAPTKQTAHRLGSQTGQMMTRKTRHRATWRDPMLGEARHLDLPAGRLRYFEAGTGAPIVFVHGLLVNTNLWRKVVATLSPEFRCIAL